MPINGEEEIKLKGIYGKCLIFLHTFNQYQYHVMYSLIDICVNVRSRVCTEFCLRPYNRLLPTCLLSVSYFYIVLRRQFDLKSQKSINQRLSHNS